MASSSYNHFRISILNFTKINIISKMVSIIFDIFTKKKAHNCAFYTLNTYLM